jgi:hypothetical protein
MLLTTIPDAVPSAYQQQHEIYPSFNIVSGFYSSKTSRLVFEMGQKSGSLLLECVHGVVGQHWYALD